MGTRHSHTSTSGSEDCTRITKVAQSGQGSAKRRTSARFTALPHFRCARSTMEEFVADEVESILYIAREISGMPHALPHDTPVRERSSIQDPSFEGQ